MAVFPTKILLATDGSEEARSAAQRATALTKKTGSELHVVHVGQDVPTPHFRAEVKAQLEQEAQEVLDEQTKLIEDAGGDIAELHLSLKTGRPEEEIIHLSEEIEAGLIVMGSRGLRGAKRLLLGSVSENVVRHAPCSVMIVRGERTSRFPDRILLATDGSEDSALAAQATLELTNKIESELHVVHVREPTVVPTYQHSRGAGFGADFLAEQQFEHERGERELLDQQVRQIEEAGGTVAESHDRIGPADREIVALCEEIEAGLVVMGSRGLSGLERLVMGSVSESVVKRAHCPVLVVRGQ